MTIDQAINYLKSSGMSDEQIKTVIDAFTCDDCISREAVMKCFKKWQPYMATRLWDYEQELKDLPSVTPQQKVGKWIVHPKGIYAHLVCSKCLSNAPYDCETNYCPNCGSKTGGIQMTNVEARKILSEDMESLKQTH